MLSQTPTLATARLTLRALTEADRPFLRALNTDTEVRRHLGGPIAADRLEPTIDRYLAVPLPAQTWLVLTETPIGLIFLSPYRDGDDTELSYMFARNAWGHGYATEALRCVQNYAKDTLGHARLVAETQSANAASRRLLERLGMRESHRLMRFGDEQSIYVG